MSSPMFLNAAHLLNTPTNKFLLFPQRQSEKPLFLLLFKTRNFPPLRFSQSGTSNFALN
jgi:hypothetical protein